MKILILGDPSSPHIIKWVRGLAEKNISIYLLGLSKFDTNIYNKLENVEVCSLELDSEIFNTDRFWQKTKYLKAFFKVRKIIKEFKPDILHAHYATSYGLLGALSGFNPYIISVWGTDVYDFPNESIIKRIILKFNLEKADFICSTSHAMALETKKYTNKEIKVIAFGIDTEKFKPNKVEKINSEITIGTIKTLEEKYGIKYLIKAFAELKQRNTEYNLKLLIVGGGSQEKLLTDLVKELNIDKITTFTGKVNYDEVVNYYNQLDIYLALSIYDSESFGVAVIEASSCEVPVIVSNVGGLPEVVENNNTGFIVEKYDYLQAASHLEKLISDKKLREELGKNGRKMVNKKYNFYYNLEQMIEVYNSSIK